MWHGRHLVNKSAGLHLVSTFRVWTVPLAASFLDPQILHINVPGSAENLSVRIPRAADASDEMRASASKPRSRKIEHRPFACAHPFTMA